MKNGNRRPYLMRLSSVFLISAFFLAVAVLAVPFYSARSSSLPEGRSSKPRANSRGPAKVAKTASRVVSNPAISPAWLSAFTPLLPTPPPAAEGIATFADDCSTPKSDFNLGEVVCAKASGVPTTVFPWHVLWIDTGGFVRQSDDAVADDQYPYRFTLPATATSDVNGQMVNNLGTWKVNLTRSNGAVRQTARFVVHQPTNPASDVFVQKFVHSASSSVSSGDNISFTLVVGNAGPDDAAGVHLIDSVPTGASLVQFTQNSGPACLPAGSNDCTIATMANGARAEFTAIYNTGAMAPGDYDTSAAVSSTTPDPDSSNNSSTASFSVTPSTGTTDCQLICPENINANANTTEGGQRGAHVSYTEPVSSGTCGAISSVPSSGSFFPVGQTVVNATSETGNGACSFTITVTDDGTNPPTISCPSNKTANANGDCEATVVLGTPTTSGDNVTVVGSRSDGKPMYDCDINGNNCTRKNPDLPFSAGVTTVTWTATSHDTLGNERGNASCQQTVTVNDTTPPVITATDQTVSADANCQAAVPDYSNQVADNCSCASDDNSQGCAGAHRIATTQDPAAGTLVGPGSYTIHLTANDGSSNNGGAGNTTTKDVTFTVNDTTAPVITCPGNVTANTDAGTCSATVNPGTATATDNCGSPTVTGTRSDGQALNAPYPKGTTTIAWKATDAAGNHSECAQTVTVADHENPSITCPANITTNEQPGTCAAHVNPGTPTASDNCGSPTVSGSRSDGRPLSDTYPLGTTTITWTATDSSGNQSSCTQTITVVDNVPPTITFDSLTIFLNNVTIVFTTNSVTINGTTYPFNGTSCSHEGYTISFNGSTLTITYNGHSASYTFSGKTLVLWTPTHQYQTVKVSDLIASASDDCDSGVDRDHVRITQVTSDEPDDIAGGGDGNTVNDMVIASDCKSVQLRAERNGNGNGRVYTITFKVRDASGNTTTATSKLKIFANSLNVVDDGPQNTVNGTCPLP
jgi:uncharacterized repeat protein (TIGR01451 family)